MEMVELESIDLRLSHTRCRDTGAERRLLPWIMERGIQDPLMVAGYSDTKRWVLLDGFKRYRCAKKSGMGMIAVECIADTVAEGMLSLLRRDQAEGLNTIEQAELLNELHHSYAMSMSAIAHRLGRSVSWVSMRVCMIKELSAVVREKIMSGAFPARAYLYGLKNFTRVKGVNRRQVDTFVEAVSAKGLSTRELDHLCRAYFTGGETVRRLIIEGDPHRALAVLADGITDDVSPKDTALQPKHLVFVKDLRTVAGCMRRIVTTSAALPKTASVSWMQPINLYSEVILERLEEFSKVIRELYHGSRSPNNSTNTPCQGSES